MQLYQLRSDYELLVRERKIEASRLFAIAPDEMTPDEFHTLVIMQERLISALVDIAGVYSDECNHLLRRNTDLEHAKTEGVEIP